MSLINQMLKDLDKRGKDSNRNTDTILPGIKNLARSARLGTASLSSKFIMAVLAIIVILLAVIGGYYWYNYRTAIPSQQINMPVPATAPSRTVVSSVEPTVSTSTETPVDTTSLAAHASRTIHTNSIETTINPGLADITKTEAKIGKSRRRVTNSTPIDSQTTVKNLSSTDVNLSSQHAINNKATTTQAVVSPAMMQSFKFSRGSHGILLLFQLDRHTPYSIAKSKTGEEVVLRFAQTKLAKTFPKFLGAEPPLLALSTQLYEQDLLVKLRFMPDTILEQTRFLGKNNNELLAEFVIAKKPQTVTSSAPTKSKVTATATTPSNASKAAVEKTAPSKQVSTTASQNNYSHFGGKGSSNHTSLKKLLPLNAWQLAQRNYRLALTLVDQGKYDKAIIILQRITQRWPKFNDARQSLIALLIEQGQIQAANQQLKLGLAMSPGYFRFAELKARILVEHGDIKTALIILEKAAPDMAKQPEYYAFIAALYQRLGKYLAAAQIYQKLLHQQPRNAIWWLGYGIALDSAEKNNAARSAYLKAMNLGGLSPSLQAYVSERLGKIQ